MVQAQSDYLYRTGCVRIYDRVGFEFDISQFTINDINIFK